MHSMNSVYRLWSVYERDTKLRKILILDNPDLFSVVLSVKGVFDRVQVHVLFLVRIEMVYPDYVKQRI